MPSIIELVKDVFNVAVLGFVISFTALILNRRPLFRFFGLKPNSTQLTVYLSRLEIVPTGTIGIEDIYAGYVGPAINKYEYTAALKVKNLISSRFVSILPFKEWIGGQFVILADIQPDITEAPKKAEYGAIKLGNMVVIGSSIYNLAMEYYSKQKAVTTYYFDKDSRGNRIVKSRRGIYRDHDKIPCGDGKELGIVERVIDKGRVVYICAGIDINETCGSVEYLVNNWEELQKEFGDDKDFAICLVFAKGIANSGQFVEPEGRIDSYPPKS